VFLTAHSRSLADITREPLPCPRLRALARSRFSPQIRAESVHPETDKMAKWVGCALKRKQRLTQFLQD